MAQTTPLGADTAGHDEAALRALLGQRPRLRVVTLRSIAFGLFGTILICGLTPYNDYALNNTFLVGNNLPLGVVMVMFLFAILVNGPLSRFAPRWAFTSGEMTVSFAMMLVSCALPSSGLMRYFPSSLVTPFNNARSVDELARLLEKMDLPRWLFPSFSGPKVRDWMNDPIVGGFMERWTLEDKPIPYRAWITPGVTWGIFLFALYGAMLSMVSLVRKQWMENERLPFPLAQIQVALVTQPKPRRFLNDVFRNRFFWVAFVGVFFLHGWNGLGKYYSTLPTIPHNYNFFDIFTDPPWSYMANEAKSAVIFFSVVGVTYFLSSSVAFSLWAFFILNQLRRMSMGLATGDPGIPGQLDEHFGALIAFAATILWVGRNHWKMILFQAFRGRRQGESGGRYLPYPFAFWTLVLCLAVMVMWLKVAGANMMGAVVTVVILATAFLIVTRIVAETGLLHSSLFAPLCKPWTVLGYYTHSQAVPTKTYFLGMLVDWVNYDFRETVPVYASHGLKVADQTVFAEQSLAGDESGDRWTGRKIIACMMLALLIGYGVSFFGTLWMKYHNAFTKDAGGARVDQWGMVDHTWEYMWRTNAYNRSSFTGNWDPLSHIGGGFAFTGLLAFLRLRFTWWPLHPIGFLMIGTFPGSQLWFSFFWGWLAKVLIVRFGGSSMYQNAKPFFIGLIVGESMAAGFWLVMAIVLSALGVPYVKVSFMPG